MGIRSFVIERRFMPLLLLQSSSMAERKLLMAGFIEIQPLEAKSLLPLEPAQSFTVSLNILLLVRYFPKDVSFFSVNYVPRHRLVANNT